MSVIDWSACPDVERVPGRGSGQWVVVGTRILADGVIENADAGLSPNEIGDEVFDGLGAERARRIIQYARAHAGHLARTPEASVCLSESCSIRTHHSASARH